MSKTLRKSVLLTIIALGILFFKGTVVNAETMSEEFKSYLNEEGKYEMNSVVPTDEDYFALMVDKVTYDENQNWNGLMFTDVASDYSEVDLTINAYESNEEKHRVKLQWNYDEIANKKIQNFMDTTVKNKTKFDVKDLELVNYWYNSIKNNYKAQLIMYSGELKSILDYGNIEFEVSTRGGGGAPFKSETIGFAYFGYNDSVYRVVNGFGATADHIMYVPTETENTPEAIKLAAQERIDNYIGESDLEVSYVSTAWEYWVSYFYEEMKGEWILDNPNLTKEEFEQMGNVYMPSYPSFEEGFKAEFGLAEVSKTDLIYTIDIPIDENMGDCKYIVIRRDSSKMINPISKTSDLSTNIEISTNETLPLDTIIKAKELTSGSEYERIIKILNLTDNLTVDLKLYSNSLEQYITKLDDGTFNVKIPIPENLKGKKLRVYYVDENGNTESSDLNNDDDDDYAVFTTSHFSIYTLGYKDENYTPIPTKVKVIFDFNGGKFGNKTTYTYEDWNANLYDSLIKPTRDGYKFKGYFTEKNGGTKFEMILNEAGIDNNMIFYAQWEENSGVGESEVQKPIQDSMQESTSEAENNLSNNSNSGTNINTNTNNNVVNSSSPQTGDNIVVFIVILGISILGVILTFIVKKQKNKDE
ncbi:MAG: LPXTG cell wall anchor domain-containing protein [Clostridiales bacterium]|nr:LPXTG cell wall anchor domain-containing protein [Clostridiales bacterium]